MANKKKTVSKKRPSVKEVDKARNQMVTAALKAKKERERSQPKTSKKKTATKKKVAKAGESKMDKAVGVFKSMDGQARKDIIKAFIEKVGLTKAGASTYYQIIKGRLEDEQ